MADDYIKDYVVHDKSDDEKDLELIVSILKTKQELNLSHKNYEFAEEGLIDYFAYQIKANQTKLDYLMKKARARGLALDMASEIYLKNNKAQ